MAVPLLAWAVSSVETMAVSSSTGRAGQTEPQPPDARPRAARGGPGQIVAGQIAGRVEMARYAASRRSAEQKRPGAGVRHAVRVSAAVLLEQPLRIAALRLTSGVSAGNQPEVTSAGAAVHAMCPEVLCFGTPGRGTGFEDSNHEDRPLAQSRDNGLLASSAHLYGGGRYSSRQVLGSYDLPEDVQRVRHLGDGWCQSLWTGVVFGFPTRVSLRVVKRQMEDADQFRGAAHTGYITQYRTSRQRRPEHEHLGHIK
ncbi:hypothetical protein VTN02DRAFT_4991 [Thermoascus thermophilus]